MKNKNKQQETDAPASEWSDLLGLKKIILWIPYAATMAYLWWFGIWLKKTYYLSNDDVFLIGAATIFYGALLCGSQDIRLKYWSK